MAAASTAAISREVALPRSYASLLMAQATANTTTTRAVAINHLTDFNDGKNPLAG